MVKEGLEDLARKILGPRLSQVLEEDPGFIERVLEPLMEKHGLTPTQAIDERTSRWRSLVKEVRKRAYYELRRFRRWGKDIPLSERNREDIETLTGVICEELENLGVQTIVDLGSGVFPLTLEQWPCRPLHYVAVDNNQEVVRRLDSASPRMGETRLHVIRAGLEDPRLPGLILGTGAPLPALGLALRSLRVLARTRRVDLLEWLASLPLRGLVASEPARSLVGGEDIRVRERRFLARLARRAEEAGLASSWRMLETGSEVILILRL